MPTKSTVTPDMASLLVGIYRSSKKTAEIATYDFFGSNFSGAAFCPALPIGGLLVNIRHILCQGIKVFNSSDHRVVEQLTY